MRPTSTPLPADPRVTADASVFGTLTRGSRATLERVADLGDGVTAAIWRNEHTEARYVQPGHHTLSSTCKAATPRTGKTSRTGSARRDASACCRPSTNRHG